MTFKEWVTSRTMEELRDMALEAVENSEKLRSGKGDCNQCGKSKYCTRHCKSFLRRNGIINNYIQMKWLQNEVLEHVREADPGEDLTKTFKPSAV